MYTYQSMEASKEIVRCTTNTKYSLWRANLTVCSHVLLPVIYVRTHTNLSQSTLK